MDDRWGTPSGTAVDRLAALRPPAPEHSDEGTKRRRKRPGFSREMVLGVVLVLLGALVVLMFVGRGQTVSVSPTASTVTETVRDSGTLAEGTALVAALVELGSFPPQLEKGDSVVVIVTPASSSDGTTRMLPGVATVSSVDELDSGSFGAVITLVSTENAAREIADAGSVHLAIVPVNG